jgi:hypothetical protein
MKKMLSIVFISILFYSFVTMAIEEPSYTVEKKYDNFEIRNYGPVLVAQTENNEKFDEAGNKAFRILADYIFGNNISKTKISMTAPVTQQSEKISMTAPVNQIPSATGFVVQFVMPSEYTRETLPAPVDPRVQIIELPPRRVAVYTYSGSWSEERFQKKLTDFKAQLEKENLTTVGEPIFARFNSPFQLWFLRRNEIWLQIK